MARKSLKPHLNQIRTWTRQGRTDAWVAHQLEVTVQQIQAFKRENGLSDGGEPPEVEPGTQGADFEEEIDLRAEDDALIAAELEAEAERAAEEEAAAAASDEDEEEPGEGRRRSRGRRGGRGRSSGGGAGSGRSGGRTASATLEGSFDHGEEGYGLWLDPAIIDDPVYAEHWAGHRPVEITIEEDRIVIRRAGGEDDDDS
jgi:hypothetical protein